MCAWQEDKDHSPSSASASRSGSARKELRFRRAGPPMGSGHHLRPSTEGFVYLAFILDACSRQVVGWSMATHLRTELVVDALEMALWRRNPDVMSDPPHGSRIAIYGAFV